MNTNIKFKFLKTKKIILAILLNLALINVAFKNDLNKTHASSTSSNLQNNYNFNYSNSNQNSNQQQNEFNSYNNFNNNSQQNEFNDYNINAFNNNQPNNFNDYNNNNYNYNNFENNNQQNNFSDSNINDVNNNNQPNNFNNNNYSNFNQNLNAQQNFSNYNNFENNNPQNNFNDYNINAFNNNQPNNFNNNNNYYNNNNYSNFNQNLNAQQNFRNYNNFNSNQQQNDLYNPNINDVNYNNQPNNFNNNNNYYNNNNYSNIDNNNNNYYNNNQNLNAQQRFSYYNNFNSNPQQNFRNYNNFDNADNFYCRYPYCSMYHKNNRIEHYREIEDVIKNLENENELKSQENYKLYDGLMQRQQKYDQEIDNASNLISQQEKTINEIQHKIDSYKDLNYKNLDFINNPKKNIKVLTNYEKAIEKIGTLIEEKSRQNNERALRLKKKMRQTFALYDEIKQNIIEPIKNGTNPKINDNLKNRNYNDSITTYLENFDALTKCYNSLNEKTTKSALDRIINKNKVIQNTITALKQKPYDTLKNNPNIYSNYTDYIYYQSNDNVLNNDLEIKKQNDKDIDLLNNINKKFRRNRTLPYTNTNRSNILNNFKMGATRNIYLGGNLNEKI